jgi:hypothetical protein
MRYFNTIIVAFTTAVMMLLPVGVGAKKVRFEDDGKSFNGNLCQPRYGTQVADFRWYTRGIMNVSSEYREVSCPIVRDDFLGNGDFGYAIYVRGATEEDFCCTVYSFNENGSTDIDSSTVCFNTIGYAMAVRRSALENVEGGYYGMYCNVPPNSWVMQYQIMERLPTDEEDDSWLSLD